MAYAIYEHPDYQFAGRYARVRFANGRDAFYYPEGERTNLGTMETEAISLYGIHDIETMMEIYARDGWVCIAKANRAPHRTKIFLLSVAIYCFQSLFRRSRRTDTNAD